MSGTSVDFASAGSPGHIGGADYAAGRRDHVVENHRHFSLERAADQIGLLGFGGAGAALVDNGDRASQFLLMDERSLDASLIRTQNDEVLGRNVHAANVFVDNRGGVEVIDRDVEKTLNLGG